MQYIIYIPRTKKTAFTKEIITSVVKFSTFLEAIPSNGGLSFVEGQLSSTGVMSLRDKAPPIAAIPAQVKKKDPRRLQLRTVPLDFIKNGCKRVPWIPVNA